MTVPDTVMLASDALIASDPLTDGRLNLGELGLTYDQTVPRMLVHKRAVHEVLLCGSRRLTDTRFALSAQVPAVHAFYGDGLAQYHDLMLLTELVRQSGILLAHEHHEVPFGHMFVFRGLDFHITAVEAIRTEGRQAKAAMLVDVFGHRERAGTLSGYAIDIQIFVDGAAAARGTAAVDFVPPDAYRALRTKLRAKRQLDHSPPALPEPGEPRAFGKGDARNVVLSAPRSTDGQGELEATVRVDPDHACLFDHDLDHIPGMLLLEAAKQLALAAAGHVAGDDSRLLLPMSCRAEFSHFAELELPLVCRARVEQASDGSYTVPVALVQPDCEVSAGTIRVVGAASP
jgi:2-oxo-3-(phosphooxy)propyl 3-oxoalkanoate synthase